MRNLNEIPRIEWSRAEAAIVYGAEALGLSPYELDWACTLNPGDYYLAANNSHAHFLCVKKVVMGIVHPTTDDELFDTFRCVRVILEVKQ